MDNNLEIGDLISVDGVEHYIKYPLPKNKFINESYEMISYGDDVKLLTKNTQSKDLTEFNEVEVKILKFFDGGRYKTEIDELFEDQIDLDFRFKKLLKDKYLMRLFLKKEKYISRIVDKKAMRLL